MARQGADVEQRQRRRGSCGDRGGGWPPAACCGPCCGSMYAGNYAADGRLYGWALRPGGPKVARGLCEQLGPEHRPARQGGWRVGWWSH